MPFIPSPPRFDVVREKLSAQLKPWQRSLQFWARTAEIYTGYKVFQIQVRFVKDAKKQEEMWEKQHEIAADKIYNMCTELGGFFLKIAQVVAKPDLAPAPWVRRLVTLCDQAPPTSYEVVRLVVENELGGSMSEMFEMFDQSPLGSASIAQVHRARLRGSKKDVVIKVQHPGVQELMMTDIRNLQAFALYMQKTDIKFDLYSVTKEMEKQVNMHSCASIFRTVLGYKGNGEIVNNQNIFGGRFSNNIYIFSEVRTADNILFSRVVVSALILTCLFCSEGIYYTYSEADRCFCLRKIAYEFDFLREAGAMEKIRRFLYNNRKSPVRVPRVMHGMVTRRVLVMEYMDGIPILRLGDEMKKRGINPESRMATVAKKKILNNLTLAYGQMILKSGFFHADPHPGNILICQGSEVALLDYGQVKDLPDDLRLGYANLVLAMADNDPTRAIDSFRELGIGTLAKCENEEKEMLRLASTLFDTKLPDGVTLLQPFSKDASIKKIAVEAFPEELFSVLRTVHILRGLSVGLGINYSCAEQWRPIAEEALFRAGRRQEDGKTVRQGFFRRTFRRREVNT